MSNVLKSMYLALKCILNPWAFKTGAFNRSAISPLVSVYNDNNLINNCFFDFIVKNTIYCIIYKILILDLK